MEWTERSGALMAWAVTSTERKATYIGSLRREQTGLECNCVCPECGGVLQAVNAGKSTEELVPGKSLRPHFRHNAGQQQDACLVKMSQIVALQLLLQQKTIYLPAQTSSCTLAGASGHAYTGTASSDAMAMGVVHREWVDEHEAKITLENGRVVWIRLFGAHGKGPAQSGDAIITIKVEDPEVSTWPAAKILEHAQLTGQWLCWERHWDDDELAKRAQGDAQQQAEHWCDHIPADLDLPASLTHAQRSESVLHWVIKGILERAQAIVTPRYTYNLTRTMPDNTEDTQRVYFEERTYAINNVRLEHRLQGVVPDVICTATAPGEAPMELMIEVAVTHKVDQTKTLRIRALGLACMEIDAQRLGKVGRTTVDELRAMVLTETGNKRWVFHPAIERRHQAAMDYSLQKRAEIERSIAEATERSDWLHRLGDLELLQEYLGLLRQVWDHKTPHSHSGRPCRPAELAPTLQQRGFRGLGEGEIILPRGLLWMLDAIVRHTSESSAVALFEEAMTGTGPVRLEAYVTVLGAAIVEYEAPMTDEDAQRMQSLREVVKSSLQRGEPTYARPSHYDKVLGLLYPRLRERLQSNKGTREVASQIRMRRLISELKQSEQAAEQGRQEQVQREQQEEIRDLLNEISLFNKWMPAAGWPHDLPTTLQHVQQSFGKRELAHNLPWRAVLASAWDARESGKSLPDWVQSQEPKSASHINGLLRILGVAWMQERKTPERTPGA